MRGQHATRSKLQQGYSDPQAGECGEGGGVGDEDGADGGGEGGVRGEVVGPVGVRGEEGVAVEEGGGGF